MQKIPLKNTLYFRKYKFPTKRYTILLLLYYYLLSEIYLFYITQNKAYFLTGLFLHTTLLYISIYIFNIVIFKNIVVRDFEIFRFLKVKGALVSMCTKSFASVTVVLVIIACDRSGEEDLIGT
jgi:hypothetical protein